MQGSLTLVVSLNIGENHVPTPSGFCPFQYFKALFSPLSFKSLDLICILLLYEWHMIH